MLDKLFSLVYSDLIMSSPILSGNMQSMIQLGQIGTKEVEIIISAPFYDIKEWEKNKVVKHTGESKNGVTDYANWVNELGGFGRHNKSEYWVNRVCYECAQAVANEVGGIVINELPL